MGNNPLKELGTLGQSIWLDYIRRDLMSSGGSGVSIEEDGLRGMTSNPSIFERRLWRATITTGTFRPWRFRGKALQPSTKP